MKRFPFVAGRTTATLMLFACFLTACEVEDLDKRQSSGPQSLDPAAVIQQPELILASEHASIPSGLVMESLSKSFILARLGDEYVSAKIQEKALDFQAVEASFSFGPEPIALSVAAIDEQGQLSHWILFDDMGAGRISDLLVAHIDPQGIETRLEQGRSWFSARRLADIKVILATPRLLIIQDDSYLNLIYRTGKTFEINRLATGHLGRVFSASDHHIVSSADAAWIQLTRFSATDFHTEASTVRLNNSEKDAVHAVVFDEAGHRLIATSPSANKVFHLRSPEVVKTRRYVPFGAGARSMTFPVSMNLHGAMSEDGSFDILKVAIRPPDEPQGNHAGSGNE